MNLKPLKEFMVVLEEEQVPYTFEFYKDVARVSINCTKFALELRAECEQKNARKEIVYIPEHLVVFGSVYNSFHGEISNQIDEIMSAYQSFKSRNNS